MTGPRQVHVRHADGSVDVGSVIATDDPHVVRFDPPMVLHSGDVLTVDGAPICVVAYSDASAAVTDIDARVEGLE